MTSSLVIEPICSSYVLFYPVERLQQLSDLGCVIGRTHVRIFIKHLMQIIYRAWKEASLAGIEPRSPRTKFTKRTLYHWASRPRLNLAFIIIRFGKFLEAIKGKKAFEIFYLSSSFDISFFSKFFEKIKLRINKRDVDNYKNIFSKIK